MMNARLFAACAVSGIAMTVLGAATAAAEETPDGTLAFFTSSGAPGARADMFGTCDHPGFTTTPVISDILDAEDISGKEDGDGDGRYTLRSLATVKADAKPGTHPVSFLCGGTTVTAHFTVLEATDPTEPPPAQPPLSEPTHAEPPPAAPPAQVPVTPKGAADTGSLDPAPESGPDAGVVALGGLALLAVGGGVAVHRRRQRA